LKSLMNETLITYASGFKQGENTMLRLARVTQQVNVQEKAVIASLSEGFEDVATRKGASERLRKELLKKATDGKYITVIDKNGKPTNWKIETYADLVARTKLQEASAQAAINSAVSFGFDLIQVSSHNTLTPLCQEFEGKIYSISGKDPDFPPLEQSTPFHPNCQHSMSVTTREGMEAQGSLDGFIKFSNDKTENYPTGTSFIPVSERPTK
jgi:hypothetical protein